MRKLKLYGEKKIFGPFKKKGFIAEISVVDGKVVVKSKDKKVKEDLEREIKKRIESEAITFSWGVTEKLPDGGKAHYHLAEPKKPTDPEFLEALREYSVLWSTHTFGGYEISGLLSEVIGKYEISGQIAKIIEEQKKNKDLK